MDLGLDGRVYIVTGGTSGLGRATAAVLVADGARVLVSSRDPKHVDETVAAFGGPEHAVGVPADNADRDTPERLVERAEGAFGRLDGLVVSVGGPPAGGPHEVTEEQWRDGFESVFLGTVRLARATSDRLGADGSIVFVLSRSARCPLPGLAVSNGLRPGLAMHTKDLADELGSRGVRVNAVLPGRFDTARTRDLEADDTTGERRRAREAAIPLRRYGDPEELGRVAAFVLSPAASYMTGSLVAVDGGAVRTL